MARVLALFLMAVLGSDLAQAEVAATSPGELKLSPSGHYVSYRGKPLLLIGDSGTQCVTQNSNLDHRAWIDACAERGIRAVHVWAFTPAKQKQDGSVIERRWGYLYPDVTPWKRNTSKPLAFDQRFQWDLQSFDDGADGAFDHYWPRLRDLCSYAKSKNILVGITVFFGWPKHNSASQPDWLYHPLNEHNGGFLTDRGKIVTAPQTISSPGNEVWREEWSDSWPSAKKTQWVWERYARELIRQTLPIGNVFYVFMDEHSYDEGNCGDHFRDFFRSRGAIWMDWGERRDSIDLVYDQLLLTPKSDRRLTAQFGRRPARPFFALEEGSEGGLNYTSDVLPTVWRYSIAGGNYFHHNDYAQENAQTGVMVFDPNVRGGQKERVLERLAWLGNASRLYNETVKNLDSMAPHNELIRNDQKTFCLANPGSEYVVYSQADSTASFDLDLSDGAGVVDCRFYNPRTGQFGPPFQRPGKSTATISKPDSDAWVLYCIFGESNGN